MAKKVFNMEGGLHSANAFTAFEARAYGSCVANATSLKVVPAGGMNVRVSIGDGIIDGQTPRRIQIDAPETIALTPASTSYTRKDLIVAYIDSGVQPTTSVVDNTNNVLKFVAVNGTPSAIPATPSDSEIQAKIGAGNQYMILAEINVDRSAVSILENAIYDRRNIITVVPVESLSGKITGSQIANQTITGSAIKDNSIEPVKIKKQPIQDAGNGWKKVVLPYGVKYFYNGSFVKGTSGNGWAGDHNIPLPTGLTFDNSKMAGSVNIHANDAAITASGMFSSMVINTSRQNRYGSHIDATFMVNATIDVFEN